MADEDDEVEDEEEPGDEGRFDPIGEATTAEVDALLDGFESDFELKAVDRRFVEGDDEECISSESDTNPPIECK